VPGSAPFLLTGGPDVRSEVANVYEIGYRGRPLRSVSYSATVFHAHYDHLRTQEIAASGTSIFFSNLMEGMTSGVEMWGTYHVSPTWRLHGGLTLLNEKLRLKPGSNDATAVRAQEGRDPERTWMIASSLDLPHRTELDVRLRRVSELTSPVVPAYSALDVRLGWRVRPDLELSVTGQNLFGSGHSEFTDPVTRTEFQRSVIFKILSRF
jgi:iron complex outermembrane receptor protein